MSLHGKAVLITGGGTGIGKGIARHLGLLGANVAICSRKSDVVQATCRELKDQGIKAIAQDCDIRDPAAVEATVAWVLAELWGEGSRFLRNPYGDLASMGIFTLFLCFGLKVKSHVGIQPPWVGT